MQNPDYAQYGKFAELAKDLNRAARDYGKRQQRREWTAEEENVVRNMPDASHAEVAEVLGRTRADVYRKRFSLRGVELDKAAKRIAEHKSQGD